MTFPAVPPSAAVKKRRTDLIPARWQQALIVPGALVAVMLVVQIVNSFDSAWLVPHAAIEPRRVDGLIGIVTAPFVHTGWGHLLSNAIPLLIFGFLVMVNGVKKFIAVTLVVWLISGIGVWVAGDSGYTVGASGIVFGWLAYLVVRGIFTRNVLQIVIGLVLLAGWGGLFWGVLPTVSGNVSWQAHLFGALGGVLAAFLSAKADGPRRQKPELPATAPLG